MLAPISGRFDRAILLRDERCRSQLDVSRGVFLVIRGSSNDLSFKVIRSTFIPPLFITGIPKLEDPLFSPVDVNIPAGSTAF